MVMIRLVMCGSSRVGQGEGTEVVPLLAPVTTAVRPERSGRSAAVHLELDMTQGPFDRR